MTIERAQELQENITKEAVALLRLTENSGDSEVYENAVALIGKAWQLPGEDTSRRLDSIKTGGEQYAESVLPMNATGMETLDNIWGLFESSVQLDSAAERRALYLTAQWLAESQNLLDWVTTTPAEREVTVISQS